MVMDDGIHHEIAVGVWHNVSENQISPSKCTLIRFSKPSGVKELRPCVPCLCRYRVLGGQSTLIP